MVGDRGGKGRSGVLWDDEGREGGMLREDLVCIIEGWWDWRE